MTKQQEIGSRLNEFETWTDPINLEPNLTIFVIIIITWTYFWNSLHLYFFFYNIIFEFLFLHVSSNLMSKLCFALYN